MEDSGSSPSGVTGEPVDISGLSFTATYDDESTGSVIPSSYTPTSFGDTVGTQTVTFSFEGTDITVDVDYDVEAPVLTGITVIGTPVAQRAFSNIDATGLTVHANFSDGSHEDVTNDVQWVGDGNLSQWGTCIEYDSEEGAWVYPLTQHKLVASYEYGEGSDTETYTADSESFYLHGEMPSGGSSFEIITGTGEYKTLDVPQLSNPVEPWNGKTDEHAGGYLIEGASANSNAYMVFTKAQYDNDTAVKLEASDPPAGDSYQEAAYLLGPDLEGSSTAPAFGWMVTSGTLRTFVVNSAEGTDGSEFVVVVGTLANVVSPMGTVKKSDFNDGYSYYSFTVSGSNP